MAQTRKSKSETAPEDALTKAVVVRDHRTGSYIPTKLLRRMLEHTQVVLRSGEQMAFTTASELDDHRGDTIGAASQELQRLVEQYGLPVLPAPSLPLKFWRAQLESYIDARLREIDACLEDLRSGRLPREHAASKPEDVKTLGVVAQTLGFSRSWWQTRIERDELRTYRPGGKKGQGPHEVSMAEATRLIRPHRSE